MGERGAALVTGVASGIGAVIGLRSSEDACILTESSDKFVHAGLIDERTFTGRVPPRRLGRHEAVAALASFLPTDRSSSITGTLIWGNSGWLVQGIGV